MAFVLVVETGERLAVGQLQPALGTLQSLDMRLFVDRQDHGVLRRLQVERHDVGGLLRERRIGADAPATPPLQRNLVLPQHPPDLVFGDIPQMPGQQGAVPTRVTGRWRGVQSRENPLLILGLVVPRLAAAWRIRHPCQAVPRKPATPLADCRRTRRQPARRRLIAQPLGHSQNDLRSQRQPPLGLPRGPPQPQSRPLLTRQRHFRGSHSGRLAYSLTYATRY